MAILAGETVSMRAVDMLRRYSAGERDFSHANLSGANLAGANLAGAYLSDANLAGAYLACAYLAGAYLAGADLAGADLTDANLAGANLAGAYLSDANLAGAYLAGAYLAGANLAGADLTDANLARANLAGANLAGADLPVTSHDIVAHLLYVAAKDDIRRQSIAGFILISRPLCWHDFWELQGRFQADDVAWVLRTLAAWPMYRNRLLSMSIVVPESASEQEGEE